MRYYSIAPLAAACSVLIACGEPTPSNTGLLPGALCGNGEVDGGEECDGDDLNGGACPAGLVGPLTCTSDCTLDTSACGGAPCNNNGVIDSGELCDGLDMGGSTCTSQGFNAGTLACTDACTLDVQGCCEHTCELGEDRCAASHTAMELCQQGANGCMAFVTVACPPGNVCTADPELDCTACQSDCAEIDAQRCTAGEEVERCVDQGGGCLRWEVVEDCAATSQLCDASPATGAWCAPCRSACATGDSQCEGDVLQVCELDGQGCYQWQPSSDCAAQGQVCYGAPLFACGEPCSDLCNSEGQHACDGQVLLGCEREPTGCLAFAEVADCSATGEVCNEGGAQGAACAAMCTDACNQGSLRCMGKVVQVCEVGVLGCLTWQTQQDCASSQSTCDDDGGAVTCVCEDNCNSPGDTRCHLDRVETCGMQPNGCQQYGVTSDCPAISGQACYDGVEPAVCMPPSGSSCADAIVLQEGTNLLSWTSTGPSVLHNAPSCVPGGALVGPDVVMSMQSPGDGYLTFEVAKPEDNRWALVVTGPACNVAQELACASNFEDDSLRATVATTAGQEVKLVLRDHLAGAASLAKPLPVEVRYATCLDNCSEGGAQRCNGGTIETCTFTPDSCWEWTPTTDCSLDANGPFCFSDADSAPVCRSCLDTCQVIGAGRCQGQSVQLCEVTADGCMQWAAPNACPSNEECVGVGNNGAACFRTGESCSSPIALVGGVNVVPWFANSLDHLVQGHDVSCGIDYYNYVDIVFQYTAPAGVSSIQWSVEKQAGHEMAVEVSKAACGNLAPSSLVSCDEAWSSSTITDSFNVIPGTVYTFYLVDTLWEGNQLPPNPLTWTIDEN